MRETTALGAAIAAGLAVGVWRNFAELRDINRAGGAVFEPQITPEESASKFGEWEKAVQMSRGWIESEKREETTNDIHETKANGKPIPSADRNLSVSKPALAPNTSPFLSDIAAEANTSTTFKVNTWTSNGDLEFPLAKKPMVTISSDLDDADEEDLFLEMRRVEILQKLKKLRKLQPSYF